MKQYLELLDHILTTGKKRSDRTGVGTIGLFGPQIEMDMAEGFPLLTTKKVHTKSIIYELLWFLRGDTNTRWLNQNGVTIWDEWADPDGNLGPVYGAQWMNWEGLDSKGRRSQIDQIALLVCGLKLNPFSRRHIVSAWNVAQVDEMALPPCHTLWQCHVEEFALTRQLGELAPGGSITDTFRKLNLKLYARSIDSFLGLPFNIASYAFLLHMLAQVTNMIPGRLIISFGDVHIYLNHLEQVKEQLKRTPRKLPFLRLNPSVKDITGFEFYDFSIDGYDPHPAIKAPVAV